MKIAVMSSYHIDDGASVHSEALVNAWIKMGHKVLVYSFMKSDFKEESFTGDDERHVIRCFSVKDKKFIDPRPILTTDFDIFIVENLRLLPIDELAKIFTLIRNRSRTIHIVHESSLPDETWFYQFLWDKVIYFDKRQVFLESVYPDAEYIPFPCIPVRKGNKEESRKRLDLPLNKNIIFTFCQREYLPFLKDLPKELSDNTILLFVTPLNKELFKMKTYPPWMIVRQEKALSKERFDDYLFASDAAIFHKTQSRYHRVVSSVIFQVIGSTCPIFVPKQSEFFQPLKDEVIYYEDKEELNKKLIEYLEDEEKREKVIESAEVFTRMNSAEKIANIYIELFTRILKER